MQQQDLHLHTSTVREALNFSALLRQPAKYSKQEKLAYVDTVISMLSMEEYSDAIIGVPGEGLNVEQRKRLTIGVELAARPQLLLFLDEPTSGLDSQTSWSICNLMEKLTNSGQAILCTIHQPSAILFQRFDRLLLLAKGGKTVYFGPIGKNSQSLVDYFVRNGAADCPTGANPAEYMLHVIGAAPGAHTDIDWPAVWRQSPEYQSVQAELNRLISTKQTTNLTDDDAAAQREFAAPFSVQCKEVIKRVFEQYWRSPRYIYSKAVLSFGSVREFLFLYPYTKVLTDLGSFHWSIIHQRGEHPTWPAEPNVGRVHLPDHLRSSRQPDSARFRLAAHNVRISGTPQQGVFLESLPGCQYFG